MVVRLYHRVVALMMAVVWTAGLLWLVSMLHRPAPTSQRQPRLRRAVPISVSRPLPPRVQPVPTASSGRAGAAPAPMLPALKLSSPVPLPYVPSARATFLGKTLHPGGGGGSGGGRGGGSGAGRGPGIAGKSLILTKALVDSPPRLIARISPTYPAHAEIAHIEGFVVARLLVGLQGQVERVKIIKARPVGTFEAAARAAILRWRFRPASFRGRPVRTWVRQRLVFRLQ